MFDEVFMVQFRAADGTQITVRHMQPDDAPYLVEIFGQLSPESRYLRFNEALDGADDDRVWAEAEHIAHAVAGNSLGLLAFADLPEIEHTPVGGARYVKSGPDVAELAVSVADRFQGLGIGTCLVEVIVDEARANGIKRLFGVVRNDNTAVFKMLRKLPYRIDREHEGPMTTITIFLDQPRESN